MTLRARIHLNHQDFFLIFCVNHVVHDDGAALHYYRGMLETEPSSILTDSEPNRIKTNRYNILTWLPMSLWVQFHTVANVYFLTIAVVHWILEGIWQASPLPSPWPVLSPFFAVLAITAVQDLLSDLSIRRMDKAQNQRPSHRLAVEEKFGEQNFRVLSEM